MSPTTNPAIASEAIGAAKPVVICKGCGKATRDYYGRPEFAVCADCQEAAVRRQTREQVYGIEAGVVQQF